MLLCYITDRRQFAGDERRQRDRLLTHIAEAAHCGVDFIQLREKDLCARELYGLAAAAVRAVRSCATNTRLLINSRIDVALATGADGVHLTSTDIPASDARAIWTGHSTSGSPTGNCQVGAGNSRIAVSCHTVDELRLAESHGADFAVFAPVFEKGGEGGRGIEALRQACAAVRMPVLALGGVNLQNAAPCLEAGAAGIAAIRLFQETDLTNTVQALRRMEAGA